MAKAIVLLVLLLAGCGGAEGWTKGGADAEAIARDLGDCQALTATASKTDTEIDEDIAASRGADLQRSDLLRQQNRQTRETTRDRAAAILAACMQAKGYRQNAK